MRNTAKKVAVFSGGAWRTEVRHVECNVPVAECDAQGNVTPRMHPDPEFQGENLPPAVCEEISEAIAALRAAREKNCNGSSFKEIPGWRAVADRGPSNRWNRHMIVAAPEIVLNGWKIIPPVGL
jgi:hypothetical protein